MSADRNMRYERQGAAVTDGAYEVGMRLGGAANPSHALALVAVDELVRCGLTDAVLAPGSRSTALAMALHDHPGVRLHIEIDERSAGFLALGIGKATGRPAVVVTTSGTATVNLHPAVVEADLSRVPLLLLTADRPPELHHTGANQTIDQTRVYGTSVRWFADVGLPEDRPGAVAHWRSTICQAWARSVGAGAACGPVHLNLPFREPTVPARDDGRSSVPHEFSQPLDGRDRGRPWTAVEVGAQLLPDLELTVLTGRLRRAARGVIVVGDTDTPVGPIHALARATGWPILAEPHSNARHGTHAVVHVHHLLNAAPFAEAHRPDLVVRIGRTGLSRALERWLDADVPQLLLDRDGFWLDPTRTVGEMVVADPGLVCESLADRLGHAPPPDTSWLDAWQRAAETATEVVDRILEEVDAEGGRPTEPGVARDLVGALPDGVTLVVGSSMPIRDLDQFGLARSGLRILANRGASGIDGIVSTVLGTALVTDGPTVGCLGDLSFLHDRNGLLLSPDGDRHPDVVFVVVDNDGGGIFHFLPQAGYPESFERVFGTPHGLDLADVAVTHDLGYTRVDRAGDLAAAVRAAIVAGGRQLVHVPTDRHTNVDLHRRIQDAVTAALARSSS